MSVTNLVTAVRQYATENYEQDGWDILVECWSDEEIVEAIGDATSVGLAIGNCMTTLQSMNDYRRDIQNA